MIDELEHNDTENHSKLAYRKQNLDSKSDEQTKERKAQ